MSERLTYGSLFSGIGGIDLGLDRAGMRCAWQVELDPFCRRILTKHWSEVPKYEDVTALDPRSLEPVDVIAGGFPCQPVSVAGKRKAQADTRWLWPDYLRIVRHLRPRYVFVENVPGLYTAGLGYIVADLAKIGYDAEWDCLSAEAFGAPHLRKRVVLLAYPQGTRAGLEVKHSNDKSRRSSKSGTESIRQKDGVSPDMGSATGRRIKVADTDEERQDGWQRGVLQERPSEQSVGAGSTSATNGVGWWAVEPNVGRVADGVPNRVDRLKALGNAVVPQLAEYVGRRILEHARSSS